MIATVLGALSSGFLQTLKLFAITLIGSLPLGLIISFGSMSRWAPFARLGNRLEASGRDDKFTHFCEWFKPISLLVKVVVWVVRGTPLMLQLIIVYFGPGLLATSMERAGIDNVFYHIADYLNTFSPLVATVVAFVINYACYFSEIYRGGIESIPRGQYEAGQVLGMTKTQIFFRVILLQVIKRIVPPMSNEIITLVKDTALARVIMVAEILKMAEEFTAIALIWPMFYTAVFYLAFVGILTLLFGYFEKKLSYYRV